MKKLLILLIFIPLTYTTNTKPPKYVTYTPIQKNTPNEIMLKQGGGGGGNYCSCYETYDVRSINTGCYSCPSRCFKYRASGNHFSCGTCMNGCSTCIKASTCSSCSSGYFLRDQLCSKCEVNYCKTCSGPGPQCNSCNSGRYFNGDICDTCMANCVSCRSGDSCDECRSEHFFDGYKCDKCMANCKRCMNKTTCNSCYTFFEWSSAEGICKEMPWWKKILIWIGIIFAVIFFGICILICCLCSAVDEVTGRRHWGRRHYYNNGGYHNHGPRHHHGGHHHGGRHGAFNGKFSDGNEHNIGYGGQY